MKENEIFEILLSIIIGAAIGALSGLLLGLLLPEEIRGDCFFYFIGFGGAAGFIGWLKSPPDGPLL